MKFSAGSGMGGDRQVAMAAMMLLGLTVAISVALAENDAAPGTTPSQGGKSNVAEVTVLGGHEVEGVLGREVRSATDENMGRIVDVLVDRKA